MIAETKTARHQFIVQPVDTEIDPNKPGTIFEISNGDTAPQRVFIKGEIHEGKVLHTRGNIAEDMKIPLNSVSVRFNRSEQNQEITFQRFKNFIKSKTKYYPREDVARVIPDLLTVKSRSHEPKPQDTSSEVNNLPGFFTFSDGSIVHRLNQKQIEILELITQKANENKPVTRRDLIIRGVIDRETTPQQIQNVLVHLNLKLTEQSPWELAYVPNYYDEDTQREVYAFTYKYVEPAKQKSLTSKERNGIKNALLKLTVLDLLNEINEGKTNINYNVRIRLGDYLLRFRSSMNEVFGIPSDEDLNDLFINELELAFDKSKEPKSKKYNQQSQTSQLDQEISKKVGIVRQKGINTDLELRHIQRMLATTAYQTKEEK